MLKYVTLLLVLLAFSACEERTQRLTEPARVEQVMITVSNIGIDVEFILADISGDPTIVLLGRGVLLIEDYDPDSTHDLSDTSGVLLRIPISISRNNFSREWLWTGAKDRLTDICQMGIFPYTGFSRPPRTRYGRVRVALTWPVGPLIGSTEFIFPDSVVVSE